MGKMKDAFTPWMRVCDYEDDFSYRQREWIESRPVEREVEQREVKELLDFQIKYTNAYGGPGVYGVSLPPQDNIFEQLVRMARHWKNPTFYWLMKSDMGYREIEIYGDLQWTEMEL